jgi:hypothetical protein
MGNQILSDLNNVHRIRQGFCRIPIGRNPARIKSCSVEFKQNSGRIPTDGNSTKTLSDPIGIL